MSAVQQIPDGYDPDAVFAELMRDYLYPSLVDERLDAELNALTEAMADDTDPERTSGAYGHREDEYPHKWREFHVATVRAMEPAKWPMPKSYVGGLTQGDIVSIRQYWRDGTFNRAELAERFEVCIDAITRIVRGHHFRNAGGPITKRVGGQRFPAKHVEDVRRAYTSGEMNQRELAESLGLSLNTIWKMVNGVTYSNVKHTA